MSRLLAIAIFIQCLWTGLARAESDLSWFEQLRLLRFGNEKIVNIQNGVLDLNGLKDDEYWQVRGTALFFPGEFLEPELFQKQGYWESVVTEKKPLTIEMNARYFPQPSKVQTENFGTFVVKFVSNERRSLNFYHRIYHSLRLFHVTRTDIQIIQSEDHPSSNPLENKSIRTVGIPQFNVLPQGESYLLYHVSSPITERLRTPNISQILIGPQRYFDSQMNIIQLMTGIIIGSFFIASIFYGFIFSFRRSDISSLYLSAYAIASLLMSSLGYFNILSEGPTFGNVFTFFNVIGYSCLQLFTHNKIQPYISPKASRLILISIGLSFSSIVLSLAFNLRMLTSQLNVLVMMGSLFLIGLTIFLGLKHSINGILFFIAGATMLCILQGSVTQIGILNLNKEYGQSIALSNLFMTIALALVNAKEFARTYLKAQTQGHELQVLLKEVQEKEKARTLFFQNTSHELRTPLNGIIGFMQLIAQKRYGSIPVAVEEQLLKCIRLAVSLKNQVNTILDLAKSKKGNLTLSNSAIDLSELIRTAEDLAAGLLLKRPNLHFRCHSLWERNQSQFIGDRDKLQAILRNLLGNAFKFADPHRPNTVELTLKREFDSLQITVSDTGIGIPLEHQDKIFEEFQQISGDARRAYEGTGLGLAMVRDFTRLMGGEIHLESQTGVGSRFSVQIPAQTEIHLQQSAEITSISTELSREARPKSSVQPIEAKSTIQGHLLVVDDNEMNCEVLKDLLDQEGFAVSTVLDGQEALKMMRRDRPDLVLLDMMMPYFSGEDVIKAMQADSLLQDIPVILITARASDDDRLFGLSLGADDYLAKPIHHEELLFRVKNILHRLAAKQKIVEAEEGQKMAQLGRLMQEFSHELKNVFQMDVFKTDEIPEACETILNHVPIKSPEWAKATKLIGADRFIPAENVSYSDLAFADSVQSQSKSLRYLRVTLSVVDMDPAERLKIWQEILSLSKQEIDECEQTVYIIRTFLVLQHQAQYASNLVKNILEYSREGHTQQNCFVRTAIEAIVRLVKPRMQRLGIKIELPGADYAVSINPGHMMQVLLNILSNACDAVENLEKSERWIKLAVETNPSHTIIVCSNGGPPLSAEKAHSMLQDSWSSKGNKGFGLGLGISLRLLQKAHGTLEVHVKAPHPEIRLILMSSLAEAARQSA